VKCSLIDEYVKKPSAHGMSTFNGSNVTTSQEEKTKTLLLGLNLLLALLRPHSSTQQPL
jgi:hypothetical protein